MSDTIVEFGREVRSKLLDNGFSLSEPVVIGRMDFEGSGDSGYVQPLDCELHSISEISENYAQEIEDWGNRFVDNASPGWEINGGGEGCLLLSIDSDNIKAVMEMSQWFTDVEHYSDDDCYIAFEEDEEEWNGILQLWLSNRPVSDDKLCIKVLFEGSGDSGSIDEVGIYKVDENHRFDNAVMTDFLEEEWNDKSVSKIIEDWSYSILDSIGIDWYNNSGGEGYISIFIDTIIEENGDKLIRYEWSIESFYGESNDSTYEECFNLTEEE